MSSKSFTTKLVARGPKGAWTFMPIPFDVEEAFGKRSRVAVCGTVNGFAFRNSIMPSGDGRHEMMFSKTLQAGAKVGAGDLVTVIMQIDVEPRTVELPEDFANQLAADAQASRLFDALSVSRKKEFVNWMISAKRPETRQRRMLAALDMLRRNTSPNP